MTKKNMIVVAPLPSLAPLVRRELPVTREQKKSAILARTQGQDIEQQRQLAILAQFAAAAISESGFTIFTQTTERMYEFAREPGRAKDLQEQIDVFYEASVQRMSAYIVRVNDQAVMNIGQTIARGTYVEDIQPQGFFARLRGEV